MVGLIILRVMLEQGAATAVVETTKVATGAVARGVVPAGEQAVAQAAAWATAAPAVVQTTAVPAVDLVETALMLQPDRLTVAVSMEPLEVEWPAMVQAVVLLSV